jgi:hypothetical protein
VHLSLRHLALAAGSLFAATAAVDIPHVQNTAGFEGPADYVLEVLFSLSLAASAASLWRLRGAATTRGVRIGVTVPLAGYALLTVVTAATAAAARNVLGPLFALGLLLVLTGSLALAMLDLRGRIEPRGVGAALVAGVVAMTLLGEGYGLLAWSAAWFAVAALAHRGYVTTTSTRWNSLSSV